MTYEPVNDLYAVRCLVEKDGISTLSRHKVYDLCDEIERLRTHIDAQAAVIAYHPTIKATVLERAVTYSDAQEVRIATLEAELADTRETYESMFAEAGRDAEKYRTEIATLEADLRHSRQCCVVAHMTLVSCEDNTEGYYTRIEAVGTASDGWRVG